MKLAEHSYFSAGVWEYYIRDEHLPLRATSCGHDGRQRRLDETLPTEQRFTLFTDHQAATAPKTMQPRDAGPGRALLDCPCDVKCPRCGAGTGRFCSTLDGGGTSGGGYYTNWHTARVKASPRCKAIAAGEKTRCDLGDHEWQSTGNGHTAKCARCEVTADYAPRSAP